MNKSRESCLHICKKRQIYSIPKVKAPFSNFTVMVSAGFTVSFGRCVMAAKGGCISLMESEWMPNTMCSLLPSLVTVTDCNRLLLGNFFQQVAAPAHTARLTQEWIVADCPEFICKEEWPPNLPDLNPLDYHVWGAMLDLYQKYQPRQTNISELKSNSSVDLEWLAAGSHWQIHSEFHKRLTACILNSEWLTNCIIVATICCTSC